MMRKRMRTKGFVILAASALALFGCGEEASTSKDVTAEEAGARPAKARVAKYYQYKSGMIEYTLSGARAGTEALYWDDWGGRQARYTKASLTMMGLTQTTDDWVITLPDVVYAIDMKTKTATRSTNPVKAFAEGLSDEELEELGRRMTEAMGAKMVGTDTVAGHACELWRTEELKTETCMHKGVALRTMSNMMGMELATVATKIELDASVDQSHFKVPSDVTVREAPEIPADVMESVKEGMTRPETDD